MEEDEAETIAAIGIRGTNDGIYNPDANKDSGDGDSKDDGDGDGNGEIHWREEGNLKFILIENR